MKKRTFKVRFFYGYMDLSPFTYICFANIGCGSEKHIQVNLICFSLAFRYICKS